MNKLKDLKTGSVPLPPKDPVLSKCPHCGKINPLIQALQIAESEDAVMLAFVPVDCCRKIVACQLIAKATPSLPPIPN